MDGGLKVRRVNLSHGLGISMTPARGRQVVRARGWQQADML